MIYVPGTNEHNPEYSVYLAHNYRNSGQNKWEIESQEDDKINIRNVYSRLIFKIDVSGVAFVPI